MDMNKLFKAAKTAGIAPFEARIMAKSKLSVTVFDGELENYTIADDGALKIRGLSDGKCGTFTSDRADDEVIDCAVTALKQSAEYGNPLDPELFIDGGKYKYEKVETYSAATAAVSAERFIAAAKDIAASALGADSRIEHVNVELEYECESQHIVNDNGLDVCGKTNSVTVYASAKAKGGDEVQSGSHYEIVRDFDGFDGGAFVKTLVEKTLAQLGGGSVATGKYKVVYSPDCVALLVRTLCDGFSAFTAEKDMSLLKDKIGKRIFSPLFGVEQTPIGKDVFCAAFDDEGVPCKNMPLIDGGTPAGFVYDLETAKRAGVRSTGNGTLVGGNIRPAVGYVTVRSGDMSEDELIAHVGDGLYIADLSGANAGMDAQSGNYSLQASGFFIKNGKLGTPVSLMTVAGNILTDFANITAVGNNAKLTYYAVKTPSVAVSELSVSGVKSERGE